MGIEYRLRFPTEHGDMDRRLRTLRFYSNYDLHNRVYNLRIDPTTTSGMPNAWVRIEPDGLYFCDAGGPNTGSALIFRAIIDLALQWSQTIEVEQL